VRQAIQAAGEKMRREIVDLGCGIAAEHDEMLRAYCAGQQFRFDILMDIGGFRDLHRHRRVFRSARDSRPNTDTTYLPNSKPPGAASYDAAMKQARPPSISSRGGREMKPPRMHSTQSRWAIANERSSKWTSPRWSTFPNFAPARRTYLLSQRGVCDV